MQTITEDAAYAMGAKGAPANDSERVLFEAWMRGHCWALSAAWDGTGYRSDAEKDGDLDPRAMSTRRLWAAWRDRAALTPLRTTKGAATVSDTYKIKVIDARTDEVVKTFETATERAADRLDRGLSINMNHADYYTEIESPKEQA